MRHCFLPPPFLISAVDRKGVPLPAALGNSDMSVEGIVWDKSANNPNPKHLQVGTHSFPTRHIGRGGASSGTPTGEGGSSSSRRGLGTTEKIGITRIPDRAWTIALDYLELGEVIKIIVTIIVMMEW